jgi:hypothetical protein
VLQEVSPLFSSRLEKTKKSGIFLSATTPANYQCQMPDTPLSAYHLACVRVALLDLDVVINNSMWHFRFPSLLPLFYIYFFLGDIQLAINSQLFTNESGTRCGAPAQDQIQVVLGYPTPGHCSCNGRL